MSAALPVKRRRRDQTSALLSADSPAAAANIVRKTASNQNPTMADATAPANATTSTIR